jgi:ABC-type Fe3+/spermidine/putrescine transport system ATPase subunit
MSSLEARNLRVAVSGRPILQDVSFRATKGDIMSVIGPSGCGKTTLFRSILGEVELDEGRVYVDGKDVTNVPVQHRGVGIVYQNYALFPHMTVGANVGYGLAARKVDKARITDRVRAMLDLVQLSAKEERYPHELSGGERQRVALARALAVEPRVLLLDEAFAALDATTRSEVVQQVRSIIRRVGLTTLLITHDQEEAFLFSKHVLVLNAGRVVTEGTPEEVMTHEDPFIQDFVKMVHLSRTKVETDGRGKLVVHVRGHQAIPLQLPGISEGDEVHVMIKKTGRSEQIEVWPDERG